MQIDNEQKKETFIQKLLSGSGWAIFTMFVWEMIEEGLENLIAFTLSSAVALFATKVLSTLAIITATQGIKVSLKRFFTPLFKTLLYKEGNDKMSKLKKMFSWIWANKCTLGGVGLGALWTVTGIGVIDVNTLPTLVLGGFNITPVLYYGILGILTILVSFFPESVEKFKERLKAKANEKEFKALVKEAQKEIKTEEKLANQTQAEQEKARIKAEEEAKAKAEKELAETQHRQKVEELKAELMAKLNNK